VIFGLSLENADGLGLKPTAANAGTREDDDGSGNNLHKPATAICSVIVTSRSKEKVNEGPRYGKCVVVETCDGIQSSSCASFSARLRPGSNDSALACLTLAVHRSTHSFYARFVGPSR
jgi:hypothetical protein